jgi:hypothetical protein
MAKSVGQCGQLSLHVLWRVTGFRVYGVLHLTHEVRVRNWGRLEFLSGRQQNGHNGPHYIQNLVLILSLCSPINFNTKII